MTDTNDVSPERLQHIMTQMRNHYADNKGNRITDALCHGLLAVLSIVTSERIVVEAPAQKTPKE